MLLVGMKERANSSARGILHQLALSKQADQLLILAIPELFERFCQRA